MSKKKRRNRLSIRIALITVIAALAGLAGILRLSYQMRQLEQTYNRTMEENYEKMEEMHRISRQLQQHQSMLYAYLLEDDPGKCDTLEKNAKELEFEIKAVLTSLREHTRGGEYETYYHDIFSGLVGYFKNVEFILDFSKAGDTATAAYYMKTSLQDYIIGINASVDHMGSLVEADMRTVRDQINVKILQANQEAMLMMVVVGVATLICLVFCSRISDEMVGTDLLTGAANFDRLLKYGEKLQKKGKLKQFTGIAVSIRNFKFINQEYGSSVGDSVLQQYAAKLSAMLVKGEMLARNGGDNFLLLLHTGRVKAFLERIPRMEIDVPGENGSDKMVLASRCGMYQAEEKDAISDVLDACTLALNDARKQKNVDQVWFESSMYGELQQRKDVLEAYRIGLVEREFLVYYQPKVDMRNNHLCGCEALVRWKRNGKIVPPYEFIPILEAEGNITLLDFYVFDTVCRDIRDWLDRGITPVRVSSNFSKLHLKNEDFADKILHIMEKYHLDGTYIEVELTESSGYESFDALKSFVACMKEHGIHTSIDDFGTGYSSLSLLKDLDADMVKLDRSFLFGLESGNVLIEKLITNIVRMIRDLERDVICEGVETKRHVEFLTNAGCPYAKGFLYDRPLPHDDFEKRLLSPVYQID